MDGDPIKHVVLLILENHSFDQMLGSLKEAYPELEGVVAGANSNVDSDGSEYPQAITTERQMALDPHHEVQNVAEQLQDHNGGFVKNFSRMYPQSTREQRQSVMGYYPLNFLPAIHALAQEYTVCDHWFSSLPGPTWPNRFMALTGTAQGRVNMPDDGTHRADLDGYFQQDQDTIFDRLNDKAIFWKSYFHDIPQSWVLVHQRAPHSVARYFYVDEFFADARGREQDFPQFCYIEPEFMGNLGNDDHPPHDIMKAQKLLADVYNALRANPELWRSTLLVVFYDEHGGFYDHVAPPPAVVPDDDHAEYSFDQLGVRVPAVLVSPWVRKAVEKTEFDHTSLLKYLTEKWDLQPLPSRRIARANSIGIALAQQPRADELPRIELTADELTPPDLALEERAIGHDSVHDAALRRLRDYLWLNVDKDTPTLYADFIRVIDRVRASVDHAGPSAGDTEFAASIAEPDKLGTGDVSVKDDIAKWLMHKKLEAAQTLATHIRDENLTEAARRHAARTLELISGRRFHHDNKLQEAEQLLQLHRL